jgi:hypothetical protein
MYYYTGARPLQHSLNFPEERSPSYQAAIIIISRNFLFSLPNTLGDNCLVPNLSPPKLYLQFQPPTIHHPDVEEQLGYRPSQSRVPQEFELGTYTWRVL